MLPETFAKQSTSHNRRDVNLTKPINTVGKPDAACEVCGGALKAGARKYCSAACYRIVQRSRPVDVRFWSKVEKTSTCWLWRGGVNPDNGYGYFSWAARYGRMRPVGAHRVSWELTHGPIPEGQSVLHHCDQPLCVRPEHLFLGTQKANMEDAAQKARLRVPRPTARKLTEAQREDIRRRYAAGGVTMRALAAEYGVTTPYIHLIVHKRSVEFRGTKGAA